MGISLVVFDMAGTTVADEGAVATAFHEALSQSGYALSKEIINPIMGYRKPEAIRMMLEQHERDRSLITEEYIDTIHNRFIEAMLNYYNTSDHVTALNGVEDVFKTLKNKGIKIGLNTGFSRNIADAILKRLGWDVNGVIDFTVTSDEVPAGRPHPYMINKLMEYAGISDAREVIKVGDTEVDINEGKNAGCLLSIAVTTGAFTKEQLEPYAPSYIINDLQEIITIIDHLQ